jgi:nucleotide-binding universal stress UspA family protein
MPFAAECKTFGPSRPLRINAYPDLGRKVDANSLSVEGGSGMYKRVMVTLDGSKASEAVLPVAAELAGSTGAEIVLLTIAPAPEAAAETPRPLVVAGAPGPGGTVTVPGAKAHETRGQAIERAKEEARSYLKVQAKALAESGLTVSTHVGIGDPVERILAHVREIGADLIVMATHGRTGLSHVIFGSVAARVLGSGVRPVLMVRPRSIA